MKGIRKRGNRYLVDVTVAVTRRTATVATLDEAKRKYAELSRAPRTGGWTLGRAAAYTLQHVWENTRGYRTARINAEAALRFFGENTPLASITRALIDDEAGRGTCRRCSADSRPPATGG